MSKRNAEEPNYLEDIAPKDGSSIQVELSELQVYPNPIGKGSQACIYKAYSYSFGTAAYKEFPRLPTILSTENDQVVPGSLSLKSSSSNSQDEKQRITNFKRELKYMSQIDNHPNILRFLAYVKEGTHIRGMLLEYMEQGTVCSVLESYSSSLTIEMVKKWFIHLARALAHIHNVHKVVHRDVKIDNTLLSENYTHLKLADFGFVREVKPQNMTSTIKFLPYVAPETIHDNNYGFPSDIYSYAMFIYTVLHRRIPFCREGGSMSDPKSVRSIQVKYKNTTGPGLIKSDRPQTLIQNPELYKKYLETHNDEEEDEFRPEIRMEDLKEFFIKGTFHQEQTKKDLEILRWLMKECWRTNAEKRPKIKEIVDILDFHFEPPLKLHCKADKDNKLEINILNASYYPVAFQIRSPDKFDGKDVYSVEVRQRLLPPGHSVDLQYKGYLEKDTRFLIDYIRVPKEKLQELENKVEKVFEGITKDEQDGRRPGRVGLITLGWPFAAV